MCSSKESRSGGGSEVAYTANNRLMLTRVLREFDVKSMIDAPCGAAPTLCASHLHARIWRWSRCGLRRRCISACWDSAAVQTLAIDTIDRSHVVAVTLSVMQRVQATATGSR